MTGSSGVAIGSARLEAHTMTLGTAQELHAVFNVRRAEGPIFVVLGTLGPFSLKESVLVGIGQLDPAGKGVLNRRIPDLPPNQVVQAAIAYRSGGQLVLSKPTSLSTPSSSSPEALDFDFSPTPVNPRKGQIIENQYALAGIAVSALNNAPGKPGTAIIWNGRSPSGGDFDLITPNRDKVLIIAENLIDADGDGFVDDPDDEELGGSLIFDYRDPIEVSHATVIDIDQDETASIEFTYLDGTRSRRPFFPTGNGVMQTMNFLERNVVRTEIIFSSSGGLVELGLVPCPQIVDFDERTLGAPMSLQAGEWITNQFEELGLQVSALNNTPTHPDKAILYDSSDPNGEDPDLTTPGSGIGNTIPRGKVLIIAENDIDLDGDGLVDAPDDEQAGGQLVFDFDEDVLLYAMLVLDIDGQEVGTVDAFDAAGQLIVNHVLPPLGNNSVTKYAPQTPVPGVRKVVLTLSGSGALAQLRVCPDPAAAGSP